MLELFITAVESLVVNVIGEEIDIAVISVGYLDENGYNLIGSDNAKVIDIRESGGLN